ncbi:MAG: hypothetical protein E7440_05455 [Ruminococcaceae bacterium]|nr:hypothetical protein [Oscillospiraceae bacterium]
MKKLTSTLLTLALLLSLCACSPTAPADTDTTITNAGMTLSIPAEYRDLLLIDLDSGFPQRKMHFRVSEKASVEAAKKILSEENMGGGLLFGIGRLTEAEFRDLMCGEMAGAEVFAVDGNGNYYMAYYPSDVQLLRDGEETEADWAIWSELCEWAAGAPDQFMADNPGLTPLRRTNTSLDICLNRLLYWQDVPFTLTLSSTDAARFPSKEQSLPYLEQLTACQVSYADDAATPEIEYITLHIPEENARFDFFLDDSGLFREFFHDGRSSLYRIDCDGGTSAGQIVQDWYTAAANTQ